MKQERFEKVVEWEVKPNYFVAVLVCILFVVLGLLISFLYNNLIPDEILLFHIYSFFSLLLMIICIWTLYNSLGTEKKVYWRKIK